MAWDPARQGTLLVVDPQNTRLFQPPPRPGEPYTPPVPLPPLPRSGAYLPRDIAAPFDRQAVPVRTLTVLAPRQMTLLNPRPGGGDPMAGLRPDEKLRLLLASLDAAQWARLGGTQGIGAGDLAPEQVELFLSFLPEPFQVRKAVRGPAGGYRIRAEDEAGSTLSPAQRAAVRLRLRRSLDWSLVGTDTPRSSLGFGSADPQPEGTEFLLLTETGELYGRRNDSYGVTLRSEVPNRLKPGHLDFGAPALDALVSLAGAATLGDLVRRVGQATRVEIYADPRVGRLPVATRSEAGTAVRSGDLLQALCLAVTGTLRRVAPASGRPAFVLTDDIEGIGTRRARLSEWAEDMYSRKEVVEGDIQKRIHAQQPARHIRFDEGDPLAPGPALRRRIDEQWRANGIYDPAPTSDGPDTVAVADLPPAAQTLIQKQLQEHTAFLSGQTFRTDRVLLNVWVRVAYLVPGLGEIENQNLHLDLRSFLPPDPMPAPASGERPPSPEPVALPPDARAAFILHVAPRTAREAERAAREAARRGLSRLWVEAPETGGKAILAAAVEAGKKNGLAVTATVRLLRAGAGDLDRNVLGETAGDYVARRLAAPAIQRNAGRKYFLRRAGGDWLRIDTPGAEAQRKERLLEIAATPGLAGLVLRDTAAPGYALPAAEPNPIAGMYGSLDLGYTPEMRLAFLRREGADPLDLGAEAYPGVYLSLPFFEDERSRPWGSGGASTAGGPPLSQRWTGFRHGVNVRFLGEIYKALRAAHPELPLWIQARMAYPGDPASWYGSWDKPDALPAWQPFPVEGRTMAQTARVHSRRVLRGIAPVEWPGDDEPASVPRLTPVQTYAAILRDTLDRERRDWDGIVLDLGDQPVEKALSLLEAVPPAP